MIALTAATLTSALSAAKPPVTKAPAAPPAFLLSIHQAFVPIVLVAGAATLLCGLILVLAAFHDVAAPAGPSQVFRRLLIVIARGAAALSASMPFPLRDIFRKLLILTVGIGALQALWGILLFAFGARPADQLHFVYGGIVLLAIPIAYVYSDQKDMRRDIIMTIAALAIIGAAVRAVMTGA